MMDSIPRHELTYDDDISWLQNKGPKSTSYSRENSQTEDFEKAFNLRIGGSTTPISFAKRNGTLGFVPDHKSDLPDCINRRKKIDKAKGAKCRLITASILCLSFMTGEMVGGIMAGSLAIISDAAHLLTDFASFLIAISALYLARRPPSNKLSFGWFRIEILGAFLSILMLWVLTGVLCYSAVLRIQNGNYEIDATIMMVTAATGVAFNILLCATLDEDFGLCGNMDEEEDEDDDVEAGNSIRAIPSPLALPPASNVPRVNQSVSTLGSYGNSDGSTERTPLLGDEDTHQIPHSPTTITFTKKDEEQHKNINVKAAYIHVLGDLLQSFGVLAVSYVIYYKPEWKIADPICTFTFSALVMITTMTIMKDIVVILMEGTPGEVDMPEVRTALLSVPGVEGVHNLRIWSLTMDKVAMSCHLHVATGSDPYKVLQKASKLVEKEFGVFESTMQLEESDERDRPPPVITAA